MALRKLMQALILGREEFQGAHSEFKSAMLCGQLAIAAIIVCVLYIAIDVYSKLASFLGIYLSMIGISVAVIVLLRKKLLTAGKFVLLLAINCLVFLFASNDSYRAGVYIYYIISGLMALSLFGFGNRKIAIAFCFISLCFFLAAYVFEIKIMTLTEAERDKIYDENYIRISFISNFVIGFIVCCLIIYFLLDINHYSEQIILKNNEQLAKTNQELDRFVYSASHDLRSPLSSMLGLIDVAQRSQNKEELQMCFDMMKDRLYNLEGFINEIIDYSRNSRQEIRREEVNLKQLSLEVVETLKFAHGEEEVYLKITIPAELQISTDPTRLRVIMNNVVGNAIKYRDPSKEFQQIEILAERKGDAVELEIRDNGLGISPEHHQKVFEMFYRASEASQGSGLGLYIVKEAVAKLKGNIRLSSSPGEGTSFYISLPA